MTFFSITLTRLKIIWKPYSRKQWDLQLGKPKSHSWRPLTGNLALFRPLCVFTACTVGCCLWKMNMFIHFCWPVRWRCYNLQAAVSASDTIIINDPLMIIPQRRKCPSTSQQCQRLTSVNKIWPSKDWGLFVLSHDLEIKIIKLIKEGLWKPIVMAPTFPALSIKSRWISKLLQDLHQLPARFLVAEPFQFLCL